MGFDDDSVEEILVVVISDYDDIEIEVAKNLGGLKIYVSSVTSGIFDVEDGNIRDILVDFIYVRNIKEGL